MIAIASTAALIGPLVTATTASAAEFPTRAITLVVPYPAGGGNDVLARIVAEKMAKSLNGSIVVENRGGAGGTIAGNAVVRGSQRASGSSPSAGSGSRCRTSPARSARPA